MKWNRALQHETLIASSITSIEEKKIIAQKVADRVQDGDIIGFGSGSTSYLAVLAISKRMEEENLHIKAIPTSYEIEMLCHQVGIKTTSLLHDRPDWGFDGADEINANGMMIKGRGGALLREKLVMAASPYTYILVDPSKKVDVIGKKTAIPLEILPESLFLVQTQLHDVFQERFEHAQLRLAKGKDGPIITEKGNLLLDVKLTHALEEDMHGLKQVTGVIESGLFVGFPIKTY